MKELKLEQLEYIGGTNETMNNFCAGFAAAQLTYGVGIALTIWNPLGATAALVVLAIDGACLYNTMS